MVEKVIATAAALEPVDFLKQKYGAVNVFTAEELADLTAQEALC